MSHELLLTREGARPIRLCTELVTEACLQPVFLSGDYFQFIALWQDARFQLAPQRDE